MNRRMKNRLRHIFAGEGPFFVAAILFFYINTSTCGFIHNYVRISTQSAMHQLARLQFRLAHKC